MKLALRVFENTPKMCKLEKTMTIDIIVLKYLF